MILLLSFLGITIIGTIVYYLGDRVLHSENYAIVGGLIAAVSGIALILAVITLLVVNGNLPIKQAMFDNQYYMLNQKIQHIDSFNRGEIEEQVRQWNQEFLYNKHGQESLWTNWFFTLDLEGKDLITIE